MLRDKMLAVMADVNAQVAEREELVATIATALLTRKNLFILGDPGQAKSYAINLFRQRITGARQFERLLSKQTDEDQLFGRVDLSSLIPGAVPQSVLSEDERYTTLRSELMELLEKFPAIPDDVESLSCVKLLSKNLRTYPIPQARAWLSGHQEETTMSMLKPYRSTDDVLHSPWAALRPPEKRTEQSDRVLKSTRLEDSIYADLRHGDGVLDELEAASAAKLKTFPALSRDVYQSFYSLMPRKSPEESLSATAQKFNARILDHVMKGDDYPTLKAVCEGRELPAYEAASEFTAQVATDLDGLLSDVGDDKGALNILEKLEDAREQTEHKGLAV